MNTKRKIIDKLDRDIVYGNLEGSICQKKDLKYWAGYIKHCIELKKEILSVKYQKNNTMSQHIEQYEAEWDDNGWWSIWKDIGNNRKIFLRIEGDEDDKRANTIVKALNGVNCSLIRMRKLNKQKSDLKEESKKWENAFYASHSKCEDIIKAKKELEQQNRELIELLKQFYFEM